MNRFCLLLTAIVVASGSPLRAEPLPGTKPLSREGDLAAQMVEGIDKYLMCELAASVENRKQYWKPDFSSAEAYRKSVRPNRERLKKILGIVDERVSPVVMEYVGEGTPSSRIAETDSSKTGMDEGLFNVYAVRWPVLPGVDGEGLLLEPKGKVVAQAIALPDADWPPEMLVGLAPGVPKEAQFARRLAANGCRVIVPVLIDRKDAWSGNPKLGRMSNQPHREFIYRMAYEMGRHIIGYEVQKVLAAVDWFCREKSHLPVGVFGYGEGGLIALFSGALDSRLKITVVSGLNGSLLAHWQEPIYRNMEGLSREFSLPQLALLIGPRTLLIECSAGPEVAGPPLARAGRSGAAPGRLHAHDRRERLDLQRELGLAFSDWRADYEKITQLGKVADKWILVNDDGEYPGNQTTLENCLEALAKKKGPENRLYPLLSDALKNFDPAPRLKRQFDQLVAFTQKLMRDSERYRQQHFWAKLDTSSLEKYQKSCEPFRKQFWEEVIGKLPVSTLPMNPQTRQIYDEPKWKGYEVTLDLYPDVFAYGILLLPKDLKAGEKRPIVVCQHGLEGRPTDVCNPKERSKYYNSFGAQLAERGYIVYAPQNPYIGQDKFRVLQRKANPLGLSLFSFIVRQHERTLDWLAALPHVDPERMAFYGLSYGGKTAMRVPALLPRYCLSICSGDFNEWIRKNVSLDYPSSYMFSGEYEMPEFNLGHTFNYAEMAALIAPRPFMVERGHDDGVGVDEWIAYEYAKVRRLYSRLKIPERTEIEFFAGGHEIHGQGTFRFLQKHLNWPK
ncbi:MAG: alpha/beta hydrolase family protein [Gemmataceae bacterium]